MKARVRWRLTGRGEEPGIKKGEMIRCRRNGVRRPVSLNPLWSPRLSKATSRHVFEGQGHDATRTALAKAPDADSPALPPKTPRKMEGEFETAKRFFRLILASTGT